MDLKKFNLFKLYWVLFIAILLIISYSNITYATKTVISGASGGVTDGYYTPNPSNTKACWWFSSSGQQVIKHLTTPPDIPLAIAPAVADPTFSWFNCQYITTITFKTKYPDALGGKLKGTISGSETDTPLTVKVLSYNQQSASWLITCPNKPNPNNTAEYFNSTPNSFIGGDQCLTSTSSLTTGITLYNNYSWDTGYYSGAMAIPGPGDVYAGDCLCKNGQTASAEISNITISNIGIGNVTDLGYSGAVQDNNFNTPSATSYNISNAYNSISNIFSGVPSQPQRGIFTWNVKYADFASAPISELSQTSNHNLNFYFTYAFSYPTIVPLYPPPICLGPFPLPPPAPPLYLCREQYTCNYNYKYSETSKINSIQNSNILIPSYPSKLNNSKTITWNSVQVLPYLLYSLSIPITQSDINSNALLYYNNTYDIYSPHNFLNPGNYLDPYKLNSNSSFFVNYKTSKGYVLEELPSNFISTNSTQVHNILTSSIVKYKKQGKNWFNIFAKTKFLTTIGIKSNNFATPLNNCNQQNPSHCTSISSYQPYYNAPTSENRNTTILSRFSSSFPSFNNFFNISPFYSHQSSDYKPFLGPITIKNPVYMSTTPNGDLYVISQASSSSCFIYILCGISHTKTISETLVIIKAIPKGYYNLSIYQPGILAGPIGLPSSSLGTWNNMWKKYWKNVITEQSNTVYVTMLIPISKGTINYGSLFTFVISATKAVGNFFKGIGVTIKNVAKSVWNGLGHVINGVGNWFKHLFVPTTLSQPIIQIPSNNALISNQIVKQLSSNTSIQFNSIQSNLVPKTLSSISSIETSLNTCSGSYQIVPKSIKSDYDNDLFLFGYYSSSTSKDTNRILEMLANHKGCEYATINYPNVPTSEFAVSPGGQYVYIAAPNLPNKVIVYKNMGEQSQASSSKQNFVFASNIILSYSNKLIGTFNIGQWLSVGGPYHSSKLKKTYAPNNSIQYSFHIPLGLYDVKGYLYVLDYWGFEVGNKGPSAILMLQAFSGSKQLPINSFNVFDYILNNKSENNLGQILNSSNYYPPYGWPLSVNISLGNNQYLSYCISGCTVPAGLLALYPKQSPYHTDYLPLGPAINAKSIASASSSSQQNSKSSCSKDTLKTPNNCEIAFSTHCKNNIQICPILITRPTKGKISITSSSVSNLLGNIGLNAFEITMNYNQTAYLIAHEANTQGKSTQPYTELLAFNVNIYNYSSPSYFGSEAYTCYLNQPISTTKGVVGSTLPKAINNCNILKNYGLSKFYPPVIVMPSALNYSENLGSDLKYLSIPNLLSSLPIGSNCIKINKKTLNATPTKSCSGSSSNTKVPNYNNGINTKLSSISSSNSQPHLTTINSSIYGYDIIPFNVIYSVNQSWNPSLATGSVVATQVPGIVPTICYPLSLPYPASTNLVGFNPNHQNLKKLNELKTASCLFNFNSPHCKNLLLNNIFNFTKAPEGIPAPQLKSIKSIINANPQLNSLSPYLCKQTLSIPGSGSSTEKTNCKAYTAKAVPATPNIKSNNVVNRIEGSETFLQELISNNYYLPNLSDKNLIIPPILKYNLFSNRLFGELYVNLSIIPTKYAIPPQIINSARNYSYSLIHFIQSSSSSSSYPGYAVEQSNPVNPIAIGISSTTGYYKENRFIGISKFNYISTTTPTFLNITQLYKFDIYKNSISLDLSNNKYMMGYNRLIYTFIDRFNNTIFMPIDVDFVNITTIKMNSSESVNPNNSNQTIITINGTIGHNKNSVFTSIKNGYIYLYFDTNLNYYNLNNGHTPTSINPAPKGYYTQADICAFGLPMINCQVAKPLASIIQPKCSNTNNNNNIFSKYICEAQQNSNNEHALVSGPSTANTINFHSPTVCKKPAKSMLNLSPYNCNIYGDVKGKNNKLLPITSTLNNNKAYCVPDFINGTGTLTTQLGLVKILPINNGQFTYKFSVCGTGTAKLIANYYGSPTQSPEPEIFNQTNLSNSGGKFESMSNLTTFKHKTLEYNYSNAPNSSAISFPIGSYLLSFGDISTLIIIIATIVSLLMLNIFLKRKSLIKKNFNKHKHKK